jgi:hypothetical protein
LPFFTATPERMGLEAIAFAAGFSAFFAIGFLPFFIIAIVVSLEGKTPSVLDSIFFAPPMQDEVLSHPSVHLIRDVVYRLSPFLFRAKIEDRFP